MVSSSFEMGADKRQKYLTLFEERDVEGVSLSCRGFFGADDGSASSLGLFGGAFFSV